MEIKKSIGKRICLLAAVLAVGLCVIFTNNINVQAASSDEYINLFENVKEGAVVQSGGRYFKYKGSTVYVSKTKNGTYKKLANTSYSDAKLYSNGKQIYYLKDKNESVSVLYRYTIKTGKSKKVKTIPYVQKYAGSNYIEYVYGNCVFVERWNALSPSLMYVYNVKTHKATRYDDLCMFSAAKGRYLVGTDGYADTETCLTNLHVWKISANSVKRIRKIGVNSWGAAYIHGNQIYYAVHDKNDPFANKRTKFYQCNLDGSGIKGLHIANQYWSSYELKDITATYCVYRNDKGNTYRYTYATKKSTLISAN